MQTYFTDYGMIEAPDQETANRRAYVRWLEEGWDQGGYKPMTRSEFEAAYPEGTLQTTEGNNAVR